MVTEPIHALAQCRTVAEERAARDLQRLHDQVTKLLRSEGNHQDRH